MGYVYPNPRVINLHFTSYYWYPEPLSSHSGFWLGSNQDDMFIIGKMLGWYPWGGGPLKASAPYKPYIMGIYWVYPLLKGSNRGVKQTGALHPKGTSIFPMILGLGIPINYSCYFPLAPWHSVGVDPGSHMLSVKAQAFSKAKPNPSSDQPLNWIFTHIYLHLVNFIGTVNVGKYTIHWASGT